MGDVASLDTLHVHCMGSGIHADMRAEGILQVSEHKGSQSIRVRGEFGCLGLCQFAKGRCHAMGLFTLDRKRPRHRRVPPPLVA